MRASKVMEKINMSQLLPLNFQGMVQIKTDVRANSSKKSENTQDSKANIMDA